MVLKDRHLIIPNPQSGWSALLTENEFFRRNMYKAMIITSPLFILLFGVFYLYLEYDSSKPTPICAAHARTRFFREIQPLGFTRPHCPDNDLQASLPKMCSRRAPT